MTSGNVDNRQSLIADSDAALGPVVYSAVVWTTVNNPLAHADQGFIGKRTTSTVPVTKDTAHR